MRVMKIMKISEVISMTSLSKPTIYRKIKDGTFPSPTPISYGPTGCVGRVGWIDSQIQDWIQSRGAK